MHLHVLAATTFVNSVVTADVFYAYYHGNATFVTVEGSVAWAYCRGLVRGIPSEKIYI